MIIIVIIIKQMATFWTEVKNIHNNLQYVEGKRTTNIMIQTKPPKNNIFNENRNYSANGDISDENNEKNDENHKNIKPMVSFFSEKKIY